MKNRIAGDREILFGFWFVLVTVFIGCFAFNAQADEDSLVLDKASFTIGSFFGKTDSGLSLGLGANILGTDINFEKDLGFDDSSSIFRIGGEFRPWRRHQFGLDYYKLSRSASKTLNREIEFNGVVYPVNVTVDAFYDTKLLAATYTYWASVREKTAFGISAGLTGYGIDTGLSSPNPLRETSASTDLPVPLIGAEFRGAIATPLRFIAEFMFLPKVTIGDYSGKVYEYSVELEYRFIKNVGIVGAYSGFNADLSVEKTLFFGDVNYDIHGFQLFGRIAF